MLVVMGKVMRIVQTLIRATFALAVVWSASAAMADWHRASSANFTLYADLPAAELQREVRKLEGFDRLLRLRFGITSAERQYPLAIYLLANEGAVDRLAGPRSAAGFYRTGRYGSWAVASIEDRASAGRQSREDILLHEYTHHFFFRHVQVQRPAWYVEGFAQYFATAQLSAKGEWTVGAPANNRAYSLLKGERMPLRELLTARPTELARGETGSFYAWSWLLVHMLYADPQRQAALQSYLAALGRGAEPVAAATAAFGDLDQLERQLNSYLKSPLRAVTYDPFGDYSGPSTVERLSEAEAALVRPALRRRAGHELDTARAELEVLVLRFPDSAPVWFELALARFDMANRVGVAEIAAGQAGAEAAIDRALTLEPTHGRANLLKAELRMRALTRNKDLDPVKWRDLRGLVYAANQADPDDPAPLFTWFDTYTWQAKPPTETARAGLARAFALEPEVPDLRAQYAFDLARHGQFDQAVSLLEVLRGDPHRAKQAAELLEKLQALRGSTVQPIAP